MGINMTNKLSNKPIKGSTTLCSAQSISLVMAMIDHNTSQSPEVAGGPGLPATGGDVAAVKAAMSSSESFQLNMSMF